MIKIGTVTDITRSEDGVWAVIETGEGTYAYAAVPVDVLNQFLLDEFLNRLQRKAAE